MDGTIGLENELYIHTYIGALPHKRSVIAFVFVRTDQVYRSMWKYEVDVTN